jgi:hypothetical protein
MGTEWRLVDERRKRVFLLGKGGWPEVFDDVTMGELRSHSVNSMPLSKLEFRRNVRLMWLLWGAMDPENFSYIDDVAKRIYAFWEESHSSLVRLVSGDGEDPSDEDENGASPYVRIDSRYEPEGAELRAAVAARERAP